MTRNNFCFSFVFILGVMLSVSLTAQIAFAATTVELLPVQDGVHRAWKPKSGSVHYTMVDESTCNGTSDYVYTSTVGGEDSYVVSLSAIPNNAVITDISLIPCASRNSGSSGGSSSLSLFYRWNGVKSAQFGNYALTKTTPQPLPLNAVSGLALMKSATSTLEIGVKYASGTRGARLSRIAAVVTFVPAPTPPSSPSNLSVTASTTTPPADATLTWTDVATDESAYIVERSSDGAAFTTLATLATNTAQYVDGALPEGTWYYRVKARNTAGDSGYSNTVSIALVAPVPLPQATGTVLFEGARNIPDTFIGLTTTQWPETGWMGHTPSAPPFGYDVTRSFVHMGNEWFRIETAPGVYDWTHPDLFMNANASRACIFTIWGTPTFHATNGLHWGQAYYAGDAAISVPSISGYRNFVTAVATRYKNTCRKLIIEAWNEGDGGAAVGSHYFSGTNADLAAMTKAAYEAAKAVDPNIIVLSNGTVNGAWENYVDAMNVVGVKTDGFAFHFYDGTNTDAYASKIDEVRATLDAHGWSNVPIWDTEHGFLDGFTASPQSPFGDQLKKMFITAAMKGLRTWVMFAYDNEVEPQIFGHLEYNLELQRAIDWVRAFFTGKTLARVERLFDGAYLSTFIDGTQVSTAVPPTEDTTVPTIPLNGIALSAPLVIDGKDDVILTHLRITNAFGPCIVITNSSRVRISMSEIGPCVGNGIQVSGTSTGVTIDHNYIHDTTENGLNLDRVSGLVVRANRFERNMSAIYAYLGSRIVVDHNFGFDAQGPNPRGQFVQFNGVTGAGSAIMCNVADHRVGQSHPEDSINLFGSSGAIGSPIMVAYNKVRGGGPSTTGCGIMASDGDGSGLITVRKNTIVNSGGCGIGVAGGHDVLVEQNRVFIEQASWSNIGMYVWNQYVSACHDNSFLSNQVFALNASGTPNHFWDGGNCSATTFIGNIWGDPSLSAAVWDESISECGASVPTPPSSPSNLSVTASTTTPPADATLTWTDVATDESAYIVERSSDGAAFTTLATLATNTAQYVDGALPEGTWYYRVKARNTAGDSGYSNTVSIALVAPVLTGPLAPSGLSATTSVLGTTTVALLHWTDNSDNETSFIVERSDTGSFSMIASTISNTVEYTDGTIAAGNTYQYRVRSANVNGLSAYSNIVSITVPVPPDTVPPSAPSALSASPISSSQIRLIWSPSVDNVGVIDYLVKRCGGLCIPMTTIGTAMTTTFLDTGLTALTTYSYAIIARDAAGNLGPASPVVSTSTFSVTSPPPSSTRVDMASPATYSAKRGTAVSIVLNWYRIPMSAESFQFMHLENGSNRVSVDDHLVSSASWTAGPYTETRIVTVPSTLAAGTYDIRIGLSGGDPWQDFALLMGSGVTDPGNDHRYKVGTIVVTQ